MRRAARARRRRFAGRRYLIAALDVRNVADGAADDQSNNGALFRLVTHSEPLPAQGWRAERIPLKRLARVARREAYEREHPTGEGLTRASSTLADLEARLRGLLGP